MQTFFTGLSAGLVLAGIFAVVLFLRSKRVQTAVEGTIRGLHLEETRERAAVLREVQTELRKIAGEATTLGRLFRTDHKSQGDFGEMVLETLLESAGLREGQEYFPQSTVQGSAGALVRPDVIVKLPENRHLVIDSKVSLKAWDQYVRGTTDLEQAEAMEAHIAAFRRHIKALAEKRYAQAVGVNAPEFVFLFTPIDAAWMEVLRFEPAVLDEAWRQNVIVVSPTTLYAALRTVSALWVRERQNENAREIALEAGRLHDRVAQFWAELDGIEAELRRSLGRVESARKRSVQALEGIDALKRMGAETQH